MSQPRSCDSLIINSVSSCGTVSMFSPETAARGPEDLLPESITFEYQRLTSCRLSSQRAHIRGPASRLSPGMREPTAIASPLNRFIAAKPIEIGRIVPDEDRRAAAERVLLHESLDGGRLVVLDRLDLNDMIAIEQLKGRQCG